MNPVAMQMFREDVLLIYIAIVSHKVCHDLQLFSL